MRCAARTLVICTLCVLMLAAGGREGIVTACSAELAVAMYGQQSQFGLFFAYIFNIPGKGPLSSEIVKVFEGDLVSVGGKSKKAAKMGVGSYKAELQNSLNSSLTFPTKPLKDKRMTVSAFHDFGGGASKFPRQAVGTFDVRLTAAIDDRKGLLSGESYAHLQMNRPLSQFGGEFTSLRATYIEDVGGNYLGLQVQTFELGNVAIDAPQMFAGTAEVDLRIQQTDTQLITMARSTPPGGPATDSLGDDWTVISSQAIPVPVKPFTLEFGARALLKKGKFYFDYFSLGNAVPGPDLESGLFVALAGALIDLGEARDALTQEAPDTELAEDEVETARDTLLGVQSDLQEALGAGTLDESTEGKTANKVLKRAIKGSEKLIKTLVNGKAKDPTKLAKPVQKAIDNTLVVMANLSGLKTTKAKQINFVPPNP
jgi:hypothetical protein